MKPARIDWKRTANEAIEQRDRYRAALVEARKAIAPMLDGMGDTYCLKAAAIIDHALDA